MPHARSLAREPLGTSLVIMTFSANLRIARIARGARFLNCVLCKYLHRPPPLRHQSAMVDDAQTQQMLRVTQCLCKMPGRFVS